MAKEKKPEFTEATVRTSINGPEKDEDGRAIVLAPGSDVKLPTSLVERLAYGTRRRVIIDPDERAAFKKSLKGDAPGAKAAKSDPK